MNPFLFGSHTEGVLESTYELLWGNGSVGDVNANFFENLLQPFFYALLPNSSFETRKNFAESYFSIWGKYKQTINTPRLLQIFIDPHYVDDIVYLSYAYGRPIVENCKIQKCFNSAVGGREDGTR